jgi:hypothetical protein
MFNQILITTYQRNLAKLKDELNAYPDESGIWIIQDGISNSAGNLALHLVGNLNHFIGAVLGGTGYVRERDKEFSLKNIPRRQVIQSIDTTIAIVQFTLSKMTDADMDKSYPENLPALKDDNSTRFMLIHLAVHLTYHLGQINYHRRLTGK